MQIHALTWNLFHGRDFPPDPALRTLRSRLTGRAEANATHLGVNRDLLGDFARILAGAEWDLALLQECPPRFAGPLARATQARSHRALTSRNWLLPLTQAIARHNPDLIASWEGGSNLTLVRGDSIAERRAVVLRRRPERRVAALTRLASGLCVANLHASGPDRLAAPEVRAAAEAAAGFAGDAPLLLGGDLNLRPSSSMLFAELEAGHGLRPATSPDSIDHLLARNATVVQPPRAWEPERREVREDGRAIRLSDHAPVEAVFEWIAASGRAKSGRPVAEDGRGG